MFRDVVETFDAICVITLYESSYFTGLLGDIDINEYLILDDIKYETLKEIIEIKLLAWFYIDFILYKNKFLKH